MNCRRVVTGHDEDGHAVFASDEEIAPITIAARPGREYLKIWGADEAPTFPDAGELPGLLEFFPSVGGFRYYILTIPPVKSEIPAADLDDAATAAWLAETEQKLPGIRSPHESDRSGMHTTATVDFVSILSGEIVLEVDGGVEKVLRAGDVVVQNGTRHRWHNRSDRPVTFATFMVGARRR
jgi:mannose-6-phosphate isomerase-like protein (cupin superfamily)